MQHVPEDILIARVVDQLDAPEDWRELDRLAGDDAAVWGRVLTTLRAECCLRAEGAELLAAGASVELPLAEAPRPRSARRAAPARLARWTAAAAAVVVAFLLGRGLEGEAAPPRGPEGPGPAATLVASGAPGSPVADAGARAAEESLSEAWSTYLDAARREGVFVREMTPVVLETRPVAGGEGYEVTFLRGVVQRDLVDSVYEVGVDEQGRPMPVPVDSDHYVQLASF